MTTITIYSRHGCHLCDDAENVLESMREELNFEIEVIDIDEDADNIISLDNNTMRIKGITELEQVNTALQSQFHLENIETIGGFISQYLGRVPKLGEKLNIAGIEFEIQRADSRQIHILIARRLTTEV